MIASEKDFAALEEATVAVITGDVADSGRMLAQDGGTPIRATTSVDRAAFERLLLDVLNGRNP